MDIQQMIDFYRRMHAEATVAAILFPRIRLVNSG
jgi:hypothetical protein